MSVVRVSESGFINSHEGKGPVFLEMPHSGLIGIVNSPNGLPDAIASNLRFSSAAVRRTLIFGCDVAVPVMSGYYELINFIGVSGLMNNLARVFIDTNRDRNEFSGLAVEGEAMDANHHGVIWSRTLPTDIDLSLSEKDLEAAVSIRCERIFQLPFAKHEFERLLNSFYDPYHKIIKEQHERTVSNCGFCVHLAFHSLPPFSVKSVNGGYVLGKKASRGSFDLVKNELPDIILIHNDFRAADKDIVDKIRKVFEAGGLIVEDGKGAFLGDRGVTKIYGNPQKGVHVIGIEHVTHGIEIGRHRDSLAIDSERAKKFQEVYKNVVLKLM